MVHCHKSIRRQVALASIGLFSLLLVFSADLLAQDSPALPFEIERTVARRGYNGERCWVHARAGAIPATDGTSPTVVMTTQPLQLTGSDVFYALHSMSTDDLGNHWTELRKQTPFERQTIDAHTQVTVCDFVPQWHAASRTLLGIGQTVWYRNNKVMHVRPRSVAYASYDQHKHAWSSWKRMKMPAEPRFENCGAGSAGRWDTADGEILLPVYFKQPAKTRYSVTVCRCRFDGNTLTYHEHGNELTIDVGRGLFEPSLTRFNDRYYLTIRNDQQGFVSVSRDGLHFDKPRPWRFDDGKPLGNYNTQQHWVTHRAGLFLVYTRRGAGNDHVFRHRAPLFIGQVDPDSMTVIRSTEQILVPEHGARLGNFGVTQVSPQETWITAAQWMQQPGPERIIPVDNARGADNSIHIAKLKWHGSEE